MNDGDIAMVLCDRILVMPKLGGPPLMVAQQGDSAKGLRGHHHKMHLPGRRRDAGCVVGPATVQSLIQRLSILLARSNELAPAGPTITGWVGTAWFDVARITIHGAD